MARQAASRTATAMSQRIVQIGQPRWQPGVDRIRGELVTGALTRQLASLWVLLAASIAPFPTESPAIATIYVAMEPW